MIKKANIDQYSNILEVGCWTWAISEYISQKTWANVLWIDISWIRIWDANKRIHSFNQSRLSFSKLSADSLQDIGKKFTHVFSQSCFYHVHNRKQTLEQIFDILEDWGILIFEDFIKPNLEVHPDSEKYVYERLKYDTDFNFISYQEHLRDIWFKVIEAHDISNQMEISYNFLQKKIVEKLRKEKKSSLIKTYEYLNKAYIETEKAIKKWDLWRAWYLCKKN